MTVSIFKADDRNTASVFRNVIRSEIKTVNAEIGIVYMSFQDGTNTAREYDATAYQVAITGK